MEIALWTVSLQGLESNPQYFTHWCQVVSCRSGRCKTKVQRGEITAISWHVAASGHAPMGSILTFSWYEGIYVMLLDGFGEVAKYKSRFLNQFCKILSLWANLYTKKLVEPLSVFFFLWCFSLFYSIPELQWEHLPWAVCSTEKHQSHRTVSLTGLRRLAHLYYTKSLVVNLILNAFPIK